MLISDSNNPVYFIADVHLAEDRPLVTEGFIKFCEIMAAEKATVFIIGDLFDAWLGDDMMGDLEKQTLEAIKQITQSGGNTLFIAGNRDFLVGDEFFASSGLQKLQDTELRDISGKKILLLHGDELCILDRVHQSQRKIIRASEWKNSILAKSAEERIQLKQEYFSLSNTHVKDTKQDLLEIPVDHIEKLLVNDDLDIMIYGHIHEPKSQLVTIQGKQRQVMCLGDWGNQDSAWFGKMDGEIADLYRLSLTHLCEANNLDQAIKVKAIKVG
ncbi:MAG: UDP-2,3-diacylglucosamine diphosphatase [Candidatus Portiera sp.]|nr:UDP-2,3-diacylglucosamine diphosphatase [Portiera sp.]